MLEGGGKSDLFITVHDWLPTMAAAIGVPVGNTKPLYGDNLWPALRDGKTVARKHILIGSRGNFALFHQGWKLVQNAPRGGESVTYLFRIAEDPFEKNDLAAKHPELVRQLAAEIDAFPKGRSLAGGPGPAGRQPGQRAQPGQRQGAATGTRRQAGQRPAQGQRRQGPRASGETKETRPPYAEAATRK